MRDIAAAPARNAHFRERLRAAFNKQNAGSGPCLRCSDCAEITRGPSPDDECINDLHSRRRSAQVAVAAEFSVDAVFFDEFVMAALFYDAAAIKNEDLMRVSDG